MSPNPKIYTSTMIGQLLVANPANPRDELNRGTILVVEETPRCTVGIQLNHKLELMDLASLSIGLGMEYRGTDPIYFGGNVQAGKIHVIHSLDWRGMSTIDITDHIGMTSDIGVLAAISTGEGPELFRACAGYWNWDSLDLMRQVRAQDRTEHHHRWECIPATLENVFGPEGRDQWVSALDESTKNQVSHWL
jgi:putative AlgH/UPF0301 family transcriptional regulator